MNDSSRESVPIAVVVGALRLGDALMTLPALDLLRRALPDAEIWVLAPGPLAARVYRRARVAAPIYVHESGEGWRAILASFFRLRRILAGAQRAARDSAARDPAVRGSPACGRVAVLFSGGFIWAFGALFLRARARVGLAGDGRSFLLTHVLPRQPACLHQSEVLGGVVRLALKACSAGAPDIPLCAFRFSPASPRLISAEEGAGPEERSARTVVFAPGASGPDKRWPEEHYVRLALLVLEARPDIRILVVGSSAEEGLCRRIQSRVAEGAARSPDACAATEGQARVEALNAEMEDLIEIVFAAHACVANNSGLAHLAAACGVPVLCISGAAAQGKSVPFGQGHVFVGGETPRAHTRFWPHFGRRFRQGARARKILRALTPEELCSRLLVMLEKGVAPRSGYPPA